MDKVEKDNLIRNKGTEDFIEGQHQEKNRIKQDTDRIEQYFKFIIKNALNIKK